MSGSGWRELRLAAICLLPALGCTFAGGASDPDFDGAPRRADAATADAAPDGFERVEMCGAGYINGYLFGATRLEWTEARTLCEGDGAVLVTIDSDIENAFVNQLRLDANEGAIWIGANDRDDEDDWEWPDGQNVDDTYERWEGGEPNDGGWFDAEDCAELRGNDGDRWNDTDCNDNNIFVCECSDSLIL